MSDFYTTKELVCDETEPRTYITPVFELVGDNKLRIHHIDLYSSGNTVKLVPLRHMSKRKQRIFELEEENDSLRNLVKDIVNHVDSGHKPHEDIEFWSDKENGILVRMQKLGIEV